ncbi:multidrug ABC transporter ATP-binding protein [Paenibacillus albidus]|uniref:Multidrug ABC transporter ATP-binding protein n=1 Tax=Paenibacillus albidus TaxID=2041023 RepID=A0A917CZE9_9BACL|nr:ABC transporter transmembrane domain-containing protein [Paenibacillus albidus]GGG01778.1 multidrug ABC transporter ATP-binding protein [Paenibacillus albidus]
MDFVRMIIRRFAEHKLLFGVFLFSAFLEVLYASAAPLSLKYLVDEAFTPKDIHAFVLILVILLGGGLLSIGASIGGDYSLGKLGGKVTLQMRMELFSHLLRQSQSFYGRYRTGDLVSRFIGDMSSIERVIRGSFPLFLRESSSVILGLILLFSLEWKLTLAMLAGSVLMFIGPRLIQGRAEEANAAYKEAQERFSNMIDETVKGQRTIKSLHLQGRIGETAGRHIQELFASGIRLHRVNSLMERLPVTALLVLNGIMIGFGGYMIFHDKMTVGGFMAFFTLFMSVGQAATNLSFLIPSLIESSVSFRRVGEVLEQQPEVQEAAQPQRLHAPIPSVQMDKVTFGYTAETVQLREVSLQIQAGSYVAFVGPSGSGKSTALQLLARYYDPQQGTVRIDGQDLRGVSEVSLRKVATLVTQDTFLFEATLRENLMLGNTGLSEDEMLQAAREARIHEVVSGWPDGYDTWVRSEGGPLSGGERQRIALARALLRRPGLLLLDEVTSALDAATEADINRLLTNIRGRTTVVSVTHRLASVMHADLIYVFNEGSIAESGTHNQLLAKEGLYNSLWQKQHGFHLSSDGLHASVDISRLSQLPFFEGIERPLLEEISGLFSTEVCSEGESLVREGETGNKFYIIVRGKFEVLKHCPGQEAVRVAVLQDGDHFGEMGLLRNIPRTATVRALSNSTLLSLEREAFERMLSRYQQMLQSLEDMLRQRM